MSFRRKEESIIVEVNYQYRRLFKPLRYSISLGYNAKSHKEAKNRKEANIKDP